MKAEIVSFHQNQKGSFSSLLVLILLLNVHAKNCTICMFFQQITELQGIFAI